MNLSELLKNPIIKTIGIVIVLYFALFANKKSPDSLGNRLSSENIKKNISQAQKQGKFIIRNLREAKKAANSKENRIITNNNVKITFEDLEEGEGETAAKCGDRVKISYGLYNEKDKKQIEFFESKEFIIGVKNKTPEIAEYIVGMKKNGIRSIKVPYNFFTHDKDLKASLEFYQNDLKYNVTLLDFNKSTDTRISCNNQ